MVKTRWYQTLTRGQRRTLLGMLVGLIAVLGLLGWNVWRAISLPQTPSPLPTPTLRPTFTPSLTPTPTLTLTPSPTPTETPLPPFDIAQAGMIASGVYDARGRMSRWSTPLTLVNDQIGMSVILYRLYDAYPPSVVELQPHLQALRLWFWDELRVDPVAQAPAVAALYASDTEELYLRRDWPGARDVLEWQIAYGYARAVPDQYGDLPRLIENADSLDHRLALAAVGDGDALFSLWRYAGAQPGSARAHALTNAIADAITPRWRLVTDPLLDDLAQLSLRLGDTFVTDLYAQGGAAAVDAAVLRPPRSTAQLLHIERYLADDMPQVLTPLQPQLGRGWVLSSTETLGEALLRLALLEWSSGTISAGEITESVSHWSGDLLQVWGGPDGADAVVWKTVWDSSQSAANFYDALGKIMPQPFLSDTIDSTTPPAKLLGGRWWAGTQGAISLYRSTDRVWLVWGTDAAVVENLAVTARSAR
ncbi:MAG: hypothetical protein JXR84_25315 [Anaerolineae bacterium]|nr:hypothetical protein [Anaerolineae bacterium]